MCGMWRKMMSIVTGVKMGCAGSKLAFAGLAGWLGWPGLGWAGLAVELHGAGLGWAALGGWLLAGWLNGGCLAG
jgi:hypothetical protein